MFVNELPTAVGYPLVILHSELENRIFFRSKEAIYTISGWWFGTFFIFPYIGNNHPN